MPIEDFNEDTEDTGEGGASSKPILIVGILGLAVVLAIATVFLFKKDETVFVAGEHQDAVFFIIEGHSQVRAG